MMGRREGGQGQFFYAFDLDQVVPADHLVPQIAGVVKASLSEIKQGSFVGVTAMPQADGSQRALEVHIFPEAMRGTGEGHYPWDLRPQSTMTNANVEQVVTAVDGQTLTLKYKDGEKKIFVPANTPIVVYVQGDKSDLKPGAKVFIAAIKQPDGTLQGRAWRVGRDGVIPILTLSNRRSPNRGARWT